MHWKISAAAWPEGCCAWWPQLGDKYQVDELAAKYAFTGRTPMTIPQALEIKEELETIDRLLKQLEEAAKTAQIGLIDMEELAEYAEPGDIEQLNELARQIEQYVRELAERQGLERTARGYELTPRAYRLVPGAALGADFQQSPGVADRPPRAVGGGRRHRRDAADAALRVRRLAARHGHPRLAHQCHASRRAGLARTHEAGGYPGASHPQHAQVCHGGAVGHERLDALQRPVHRREADGAGLARAHPPAISGRSSAIHRSLQLRQTAALQRDHLAVAENGVARRSGGPPAVST